MFIAIKASKVAHRPSNLELRNPFISYPDEVFRLSIQQFQIDRASNKFKERVWIIWKIQEVAAADAGPECYLIYIELNAAVALNTSIFKLPENGMVDMLTVVGVQIIRWVIWCLQHIICCSPNKFPQIAKKVYPFLLTKTNVRTFLKPTCVPLYSEIYHEQ